VELLSARLECFASGPTSGTEDFETCLGLRSGARSTYDRDAWRERTYGLHIIDNYFPNRSGASAIITWAIIPTPFLPPTITAFRAIRQAKHYLNLAAAEFCGHVIHRLLPFSCLTIRKSFGHVPRKNGRRQGGGLGFYCGTRIGAASIHRTGRRNPDIFREDRPAEGSNLVSVVARTAGASERENRLWLADWRPPQMVVMKTEICSWIAGERHLL